MLHKHVSNDRGGSRRHVGSARGDQRNFSRTAGMSHEFNTKRPINRGGTRL